MKRRSEEAINNNCSWRRLLLHSAIDLPLVVGGDEGKRERRKRERRNKEAGDGSLELSKGFED